MGAETSLRALASPSVRHTRRVSVTAGAAVSTLTESLSFDASIVAVLDSPVNVPAAGTLLTFYGLGFACRVLLLRVVWDTRHVRLLCGSPRPWFCAQLVCRTGSDRIEQF